MLVTLSALTTVHHVKWATLRFSWPIDHENLQLAHLT